MITAALRATGRLMLCWIDSDHPLDPVAPNRRDRVDWLRCLPFLLAHVACLAVYWVGWSGIAVTVAASLYALRMFAITGFYHRYFSHRSFKTGRWTQFVFALIGCSSVQRGPLWWAAHHRHHHRVSDQEDDLHSPKQRGFLWSHMFWVMCRSHYATNHQAVPDLARYPELRWLNRFDIVPPTLLAVLLFLFGAALGHWAPGLGTNGWQMLVWGFFISTIVLFHATVTINSLAHVIGRKRFQTGDESRNSLLLALMTFGEGWHNNHHYCPGAVRQGFYWWEIDITYYVLRLMSAVGLIWDLNPVPRRAYQAAMPSTTQVEG